eukprot:g2843.t1
MKAERYAGMGELLEPYDKDAGLRERLARKAQPVCSAPKLLSLTINTDEDSDPVDEAVPLWPSFNSDYSGPYYASLGQNSVSSPFLKFKVYARASFVGAAVTMAVSAGSTTYVNQTEIKMGNYSEFVEMGSDTAVDVTVKVEFAGSSLPLKPSKTYHVVVTNRELPQSAGIEVGCVRYDYHHYSHQPTSLLGSAFNTSSTGERNVRREMNTTEAYSDPYNCWGNKFAIEMQDYSQGGGIIKAFVVLSSALQNGFPLPELNGEQWRDVLNKTQNFVMDGTMKKYEKQNQKIFGRPNCENMTVLIQYKNAIVTSYEIEFKGPLPSFGSLNKFELHNETVVSIDEDVVKTFCSAGKALEKAFAEPLYANNDRLKIKLDPSIGPYKLSNTLVIFGASGPVGHVQHAEWNVGGDLYVSFPGDHLLETGEDVELNIESLPHLSGLKVKCDVVNSTSIRLNYRRYNVSVGQFSSKSSTIRFGSMKNSDGTGVDWGEKLNLRTLRVRDVVHTITLLLSTILDLRRSKLVKS